MHEFNGLTVEYKISPRRRSIGLKVTAEGKLVVSAPPGASRANIQRALAHHQGWIEAKVAEHREAWDRLQEGTAFYLGQPHRLMEAKGSGELVELRPGELRVRPGSSGADLWPSLQTWYRRQAAALIPTRVRHFASRLGVSPGTLEFRDWKRRWGECHPDGKLRFNWRLIMLPPDILDYVVAHELAHLKAPGHNPRFWSLVAQAVPDYAQRRRWLNRYGVPFLLWRP